MVLLLIILYSQEWHHTNLVNYQQFAGRHFGDAEEVWIFFVTWRYLPHDLLEHTCMCDKTWCWDWLIYNKMKSTEKQEVWTKNFKSWNPMPQSCINVDKKALNASVLKSHFSALWKLMEDLSHCLIADRDWHHTSKGIIHVLEAFNIVTVSDENLCAKSNFRRQNRVCLSLIREVNPIQAGIMFNKLKIMWHWCNT